MKKLVSLVLALALCLGISSFAGAESEWEYKEATITMMVGNDQIMTGIEAVLELAKEKLGITVEIENRVDESVLKTRLAAGEATDIVAYNCRRAAGSAESVRLLSEPQRLSGNHRPSGRYV